MGSFEFVPTTRPNPAPYNPRTITEASRVRLKESITRLGFIKPVIIADEDVLLAGHQRLHTAQALALATIPAFLLTGTNTTDQIRFNQLHNGSDLDKMEASVTVPAQSPGWHWVEPKDIVIEQYRTPNATCKNEVLRLLSKYGIWGSCVASIGGMVLVSGLYATCVKILRLPLLVYYLEPEKEPLIEQYFNQQYGSFSYAHLPKHTWAQSLAQPSRLPEKASANSRIWENFVLPAITRETRVLDFGCGHGDYVTRLAGDGWNVQGLEFYQRSNRAKVMVHTSKILIDQVQERITAFCADLAQNGLFDVVLADSVINSVDSQQAEDDVITTLLALTKPGGSIFFSGRSLEESQRMNKSTCQTCQISWIYFPDEDGLTAVFSNGVWRYQKFHSFERLRQLGQRFFDTYSIALGNGKPAHSAKDLSKFNSWVCVATKTRLPSEADVKAALGREFDLPLPGGRSYGRQADIWQAYQTALIQG